MIQQRQHSKMWANCLKNFFSFYFALRNPLILLNEYILRHVLSAAGSTKHIIYTMGGTFGNLPEMDGT